MFKEAATLYLEDVVRRLRNEAPIDDSTERFEELRNHPEVKPKLDELVRTVRTLVLDKS